MGKHFSDILKASLPCEQTFLSCMDFSVYDVVRAAFMSRSFIFLRPGAYKTPTTRLTSQANDFVITKTMQERNSARRVRHLLCVAFIYCNQYRYKNMTMQLHKVCHLPKEHKAVFSLFGKLHVEG